jgi:hypothetical protein
VWLQQAELLVQEEVAEAQGYQAHQEQVVLLVHLVLLVHKVQVVLVVVMVQQVHLVLTVQQV